MLHVLFLGDGSSELAQCLGVILFGQFDIQGLMRPIFQHVRYLKPGQLERRVYVRFLLAVLEGLEVVVVERHRGIVANLLCFFKLRTIEQCASE